MNDVISHATRLRIRRLLRRKRRTVVNVGQRIADVFDEQLIAKFGKLKRVRRFALGWIILSGLLVTATIMQTVGLSSAYQVNRPVPGGAYHEGIVGSFSTANPLYATGAVDIAVSRLVFAGLLKLDDTNSFIGDLAEHYERDDTGKIYTVHIRPHSLWHDKQPLTADDVVFTYNLIKNADARSPFAAGLRGVEVAKIDELTVRFTLPSALVTFPNSLTIGLLPQHILGSQAPVALRNASFNTDKPIGAGPFQWQQIMIEKSAQNTKAVLTLDAFSEYHAGKPRLDKFVLHTYQNQDSLLKAFQNREIYGASELRLPSTDSKMRSLDTSKQYAFQSTAATMVFLNTSANSPLQDKTVRHGLSYAIDRNAVIKALGQTLRTVREPVLVTSFAFDIQYAAPLYDTKKSADTLQAGGWIQAKDGFRYKDGRKLTFRVYCEDTPDNVTITDELKKQWKLVGADVIVTTQPSIYFKTTLQTRSYDAVLHSISIGNDPDVYAYWHSSQADGNGMNFANWKSKEADTSLEAGRTRQDESQRKIKYKPFLRAWNEDVPAVPLFRPKFYYATHGPVYGLQEHVLNTDADRYFSVHQWMITTALVDEK